MNLPPRGPAGFTLIELLTAMAVMALALVLLLQAVSGITSSTNAQNRQLDAAAAGRRAIDVLSDDIRLAVVSEDATFLVPAGSSSGDLLAMWTTRGGPRDAASHRFLAVRYHTNAQNQLLRAYGSVPDTEEDLLGAVIEETQDPGAVIAEGILASRVYVQTEDLAALPQPGTWSTNSYNGQVVPSGYQAMITTLPSFEDARSLTNRVTMLNVWLAVTERSTIDILTQSGSLGGLVQQLSQAEAPAWRGIIDEDAAVPGFAKSSIRIIQKSIRLQ